MHKLNSIIRSFFVHDCYRIVNPHIFQNQSKLVLPQMISKVHLHCSGTSWKIIPDNLKGKSVTSQKWLERQLNDPYVLKARMENYRARSAFKLIEMDDRFQILKPGQVVVDIGAAPGSWSQVLANRAHPIEKDGNTKQGILIAVDLLTIFPIDGVTILENSDFTELETQEKIIKILNGTLPDVILSDMAPQATGIRALDTENILKLVYDVIRFSLKNLRIGGTLLFKYWDGGSANKLEEDLLRFFKTVKRVIPPSCRKDSTESYFLARKFKGAVTQEK